MTDRTAAPARSGMWHSDQEAAGSAAEEVRGHGRRVAVAQMDLCGLPDAAWAVEVRKRSCR